MRNSVRVHGGVSDPENINDGFWRIALGEHRDTCLLISSKSAQLLDFRVHSFRSCANADPYNIRRPNVASKYTL